MLPLLLLFQQPLMFLPRPVVAVDAAVTSSFGAAVTAAGFTAFNAAVMVIGVANVSFDRRCYSKASVVSSSIPTFLGISSTPIAISTASAIALAIASADPAIAASVVAAAVVPTVTAAVVVASVAATALQ